MAKIKKQVVAVPYNNSIKQTINPGDDVAIVTTSTSYVDIKKGTYLGRLGSNTGGCVCSVYSPITKYRHRESGIEVDSWYTDKRIKENPYPRMTVRYGSPEYAEEYAKYSKALNDHQNMVNKIRADYESFEVPAYRRTTLQLNRIFKIDTQISEIKI